MSGLNHPFGGVISLTSSPHTDRMATRHIVNGGWDRPLVDVLHEGTWHPGELRSWDQADDGSWSGMAEWTVAPGSTYLGRVPSIHLRPHREQRRLP